MTSRVLESIRSTADHRLPVTYTREIGRVIVRWAFFEHQIQDAIYGVAFGGDKKGATLGRLVAREPKFPDRIGLLEKLIQVRDVIHDAKLLKSIRSQSGNLVVERNLVAHGKWTRTPRDGWLVQQVSGNWENRPDIPFASRKIQPEATPKSPSDLRTTADAIERLVEDTRKHRASLAWRHQP